MNGELVFKSARLVLGGEVVQGTLAVAGGSIVALDSGGTGAPGAADLEGDFLLPGLDAHTSADEDTFGRDDHFLEIESQHGVMARDTAPRHRGEQHREHRLKSCACSRPLHDVSLHLPSVDGRIQRRSLHHLHEAARADGDAAPRVGHGHGGELHRAERRLAAPRAAGVR